MQKKINWGILGTGKIAHKFAEEINRVDSCQLVAVASSSSSMKAREFAIHYNIEHHFSTFKDLMQSTLVDVIYIATPHHLHAQNTIDCLNYNKAVLCEKPFALTTYDVERMIATAYKQKCFMMEAMWTAFMPAIIRVQSLIQEGMIGEIKYLTADFGFYSPYDINNRLWRKEMGGGALFDIGIYPIFLSLILLGKPEKIHAQSQFNSDEIDVSTSMIYTYGNGARALLSCHLDVVTPTEAYICGSKGYIKISARFHEAKEIRIGNFIDKHEEIITFDRDFRGFTYQILEVNQCIRKGKLESEIMSHSLSLSLTQLIEDTLLISKEYNHN